MSHVPISPSGPIYIYSATLVRIVDGDSFELMIDEGFRDYARETIRLRGYSCAELSEPGGPEAAIEAEKLLRGRKLLIQSYHNRQSYVRWVADVWVLLDVWTSVGEALVGRGVARRA